MGSRFVYSLPYIAVAAVLFILYTKEQERKRKHLSTAGVSWGAFVLMLLFLGLRGHMHTDFTQYYPFYNNLTDIFDPHLPGNYFEIGFVWYSKIIKTFMPNYFGWVFINTFIDLYALRFVFKRYCSSTILPFIFFMAFSGILMEVNLTRNMKALDCFFFSIPYLLDRKIVKYMLWNILGITFHTSAALFLPLYFVLTYEFPRWFIWVMFIGVTIIYWGNLNFTPQLMSHLILDTDVSDRLHGYLNSNEKYGFTFGYFERTFTFLLFFLLRNKLCINRLSGHFSTAPSSIISLKYSFPMSLYWPNVFRLYSSLVTGFFTPISLVVDFIISRLSK